jgi:hypothetical protein
VAELLDRHAPDRDFPQIEGDALLHGHCHQKAISGIEADARVLRRLGLRSDSLDAGCCGMAGAFGFEADHAAVSREIGERVLLPAVRSALRSTLIVTDGFSCREQIVQETGRRPLHLAEVVQLAMRGDRASGQLAEERFPIDRKCSYGPGLRETAILASAALATLTAGAWLIRRLSRRNFDWRNW